MPRMGLKIAEVQTPDHDDRAAMGEALDRLYGAASQSVHEIVATLTDSERARLAVFCYSRAHLNAIGLAIAATCALDQLMAVAQSPTAGRAIFAQSRDALVTTKPLARRSAISLAASAGSRRVAIAAAIEAEVEPAELPA